MLISPLRCFASLIWLLRNSTSVAKRSSRRTFAKRLISTMLRRAEKVSRHHFGAVDLESGRRIAGGDREDARGGVSRAIENRSLLWKLRIAHFSGSQRAGSPRPLASFGVCPGVPERCGRAGGRHRGRLDRQPSRLRSRGRNPVLAGQPRSAPQVLVGAPAVAVAAWRAIAGCAGTYGTVSHAAGPSVVLVRDRDTLPAAIGVAVVAALTQHRDDLVRGAIVVVDGRISRVRILPL